MRPPTFQLSSIKLPHHGSAQNVECHSSQLTENVHETAGSFAGPAPDTLSTADGGRTVAGLRGTANADTTAAAPEPLPTTVSLLETWTLFTLDGVVKALIV